MKRHKTQRQPDLIVTLTVLVLTLVREGRGLVCLNCGSVADPRLCRHVATCYVGERCGMETFISHDGNLQYKLGCVKANTCDVASTPMPLGSGLALFYSCHDCCDHEDLCNIRGCNITGYPTTRGPVCYHCDDYPEGYSCHVIRVCETHEVCYSQGRIDFETKVVYRSGCKSKHNCADLNLDPQGMMVGKRTTPVCMDCCVGDLCNVECKIQTPCKDEPSCPLLLATYDICKTPAVASTVCPRTCNMCPGAQQTTPPQAAVTTHALSKYTHTTKQASFKNPTTPMPIPTKHITAGTTPPKLSPTKPTSLATKPVSNIASSQTAASTTNTNTPALAPSGSTQSASSSSATTVNTRITSLTVAIPTKFTSAPTVSTNPPNAVSTKATSGTSVPNFTPSSSSVLASSTVAPVSLVSTTHGATNITIHRYSSSSQNAVSQSSNTITSSNSVSPSASGLPTQGGVIASSSQNSVSLSPTPMLASISVTPLVSVSPTSGGVNNSSSQSFVSSSPATLVSNNNTSTASVSPTSGGVNNSSNSSSQGFVSSSPATIVSNNNTSTASVSPTSGGVNNSSNSSSQGFVSSSPATILSNTNISTASVPSTSGGVNHSSSQGFVSSSPATIVSNSNTLTASVSSTSGGTNNFSNSSYQSFVSSSPATIFSNSNTPTASVSPTSGVSNNSSSQSFVSSSPATTVPNSVTPTVSVSLSTVNTPIGTVAASVSPKTSTSSITQTSSLPAFMCSPTVDAMIKNGSRVVRGPDWKWGDQVPSNAVGTVIGFGATTKWVHVTWNNSHTNMYRNGAENACDVWPQSVSIYTTGAPSSGNHTKLYVYDKVVRGPDWQHGNQDNGSIGEVLGVNVPTPGFVAVKWPNDTVAHYYMYGFNNTYEVQLYKTSSILPSAITSPAAAQTTTPMLPTWGPQLANMMYVGARVLRGKDWKWDEQDSRSTGTVVGMPPDTPYGWVRVKWDNGTANIYRMGNENAYDLIFKPGTYNPGSGK